MNTISYMDIMPCDIQDAIWGHVREMRQKEMHSELLAEITNDIPPPDVLVYGEPTLYIQNLHEVMDILSDINRYDMVITKCYKYLIWFLLKNYINPVQDNLSLIGAYTQRGQELYDHFNKMNYDIHRITFNVQNVEEKNYLSLLEIENRMTILTFQELLGFKILLVNIINSIK